MIEDYDKTCGIVTDAEEIKDYKQKYFILMIVVFVLVLLILVFVIIMLKLNAKLSYLRKNSNTIYSNNSKEFSGEEIRERILW